MMRKFQKSKLGKKIELRFWHSLYPGLWEKGKVPETREQRDAELIKYLGIDHLPIESQKSYLLTDVMTKARSSASKFAFFNTLYTVFALTFFVIVYTIFKKGNEKSEPVSEPETGPVSVTSYADLPESELYREISTKYNLRPKLESEHGAYTLE